MFGRIALRTPAARIARPAFTGERYCMRKLTC